MTDIDIARPDTSPGLSRRTLVLGAAWTVPVAVGLTAVPAVAASSTQTQGAVANAYAPRAGSYNPGQLQINSVQVTYDAGVWTSMGIAWNGYPTTATFSWEVVLKNSAGSVVLTIVEKHTVSLAAWGNEQKTQLVFTGLAAGTYTVVSKITSVVYSPNPVNGVHFATLDSSASTAVTVL